MRNERNPEEKSFTNHFAKGVIAESVIALLADGFELSSISTQTALHPGVIHPARALV